METTPVLSPDQLNSPAAIADPYPFYRHLRKQSPVNYIHLPGGIFPGIDEPVRAWALMKYDDVYGALRDHDTFSSARNPLIEKGFFPLPSSQPRQCSCCTADRKSYRVRLPTLAARARQGRTLRCDW